MLLEKLLSIKQKKIAKLAGHPEKLDAHDFAALRSGKKPVEEATGDTPEEIEKKKLAISTVSTRMKAEEVQMEEMTEKQKMQRERIVKSLKKKKSDFEERYGDDAESVMYATATKMAMKEDLDAPTPSVEEIAKKHDVSVDMIQSELKKGIKVEMEHTTDEDTAREIALDHLNERPDYYKKLKMHVESYLEEEVPMAARSLYAQTYMKHAKTIMKSDEAKKKAYDAVEKKHGTDVLNKLKQHHASNMKESVDELDEELYISEDITKAQRVFRNTFMNHLKKHESDVDGARKNAFDTVEKRHGTDVLNQLKTKKAEFAHKSLLDRGVSKREAHSKISKTYGHHIAKAVIKESVDELDEESYISEDVGKAQRKFRTTYMSHLKNNDADVVGARKNAYSAVEKKHGTDVLNQLKVKHASTQLKAHLNAGKSEKEAHSDIAKKYGTDIAKRLKQNSSLSPDAKGVSEGYILKKTKVHKYTVSGDPDNYIPDGKAKDVDYEIINNKTGKVVGTAHWPGNDYYAGTKMEITMRNGAKRLVDVVPGDNPQSAFNRFVKNPKTSKKYKDEQNVLEGLVNYTLGHSEWTTRLDEARRTGLVSDEDTVRKPRKNQIAIGSKVSHQLHGDGTVVDKSFGPGSDHWADVKFVSGQKRRLDRKSLKLREEISLDEGRPSQRHPLEGHDYHKKPDEHLKYIMKDAGEAAIAMKGHSPKAESKYLDQVNDAATVLAYRKKNGMQDWYKKKYGHK